MPNWDAIKPSDVGIKDDAGSSSGPNWDALKEPPKSHSAPQSAAPSSPVSAPMHLPFHRTEAENPLSAALRFGSATGKHLVATGKFGEPDVAGEDRDRATIRHRIGGDALPTQQIAPSLMINPTQGLLDAGIDTALDPTNLIPFGRIGKAIGKGAELGSKAVGGLIEHSPQIVKDAASVVGSAGNFISDKFHWGGAARRDLSPEQYRDAGLELNKHDARTAELSRRLVDVRQKQIFASLTARQQVEAARVMNGEIDVVNDPVVMKAAKEAKGLLDDAFTLESNASGRARAGVKSTKVANAGLIKPETIANAYRYQSTKNSIEHSPHRGGTFLTMGDPGESDIYAAGGSKNRVDIHFDPKNPLHTPNSIDDAFKMLIGPERVNVINAAYLKNPQKWIQRIGKATGTNPMGRSTAQDALIGALAKKYGFDSIVSGGPENAVFSLDPSIVKLANRENKSVDDFERMVPNDLPGAPTQANLKRIVVQNLPSRELPPELREFQAPSDQGILGAQNYRQTYHPGYNSAQTEGDDFTRPQKYNLLNPFAGHALERADFKIGDVPDEKVAETAAQLQASLTRRLKASATQASAGQLRAALGVKPGMAPAALAKLFDVQGRATGEARNAPEKAQDIFRLPADAARSTLTAFGLKHGLVNVPTLAALSEGAGPVGAMFRDAGKIMKMSPDEKWEFMRSAREGGVLGAESDRDNQTLGLLDKIPVAARAALGGAYGGYEGQKAQGQEANPLQRLEGGSVGALLGGAGGAAIPHIGRASNNLTWALDEAAKKAVFEAKVKNGMSAAEAAQQTLGDTVNYAHRTPVAEALQKWGLAPFATFATKIPGAVAGSVARNPRNAIMLDRITQGLASNGTLDLPDEPAHNNGSPAQLAVSNPLSETAEIATDPMKYVRAKSSDPARIAASAIAELLSHGSRGSKYMTYGQPILPHVGANGLKSGYALNAAAGDIPLGIGRSALDGLGIDEFSPQSAVSQILGPLFGAYIK